MKLELSVVLPSLFVPHFIKRCIIIAEQRASVAVFGAFGHTYLRFFPKQCSLDSYKLKMNSSE